MSDPLPVESCLTDIVSAVRAATPVVLKAPPGAGKTTCVPPAVLDAVPESEGKILLIEPRRLAARAAAARLASSRGTRVGQEIGYHVRFDRRFSEATRLVAMTTGVLLRRLQGDPLLEDVGCVILDEFHERSLELDLALGMLQRIRTTLRPELSLIVMSATLDPQPILDYLGSGTAVISEGRQYPVEVHHAGQVSRDPVEQQVAAVLPQALRESEGHLLVFLPGVGEIRRTRQRIAELEELQDSVIMELYGDLAPKEQDAVLAPGEARKIILATNVAETSITIPGVTCVIDSGQARVMRSDPRTALPRLQLESISQASAEQRSGRAGRTAAGICYRLWPSAMHRSRRQRDTPEIERSDFSGAALLLAAWGERDIEAFPWLTPPPDDAVTSARRLLTRLDAIDGEGTLTDVGRQMVALPLHPRLARLMVQATKLGIEEDASLVAAMLSERSPFRNSSAAASTGCDVLDRLDAIRDFEQNGGSQGVENPAAARQVLRVADQVLRMTRSIETDLDSVNADDRAGERLQKALLSAYPDRLARRRSQGEDRAVMVGGRGVKLDRRSNVRQAELFLCIDADAKGTDALVRIASPVDPSWLDPRLIRTVDEPRYDAKLQAVVARRRKYFEDLLLEESPIRCSPSPQVAQMLADQARLQWRQSVPPNDRQVASWLARARFLAQHMPELDLPRFDDTTLDSVLLELCERRTTIAELEKAPWIDHLRARIDYSQTRLMDQHAPSRLTVPSGNTIAIEYGEGKPPIMSVRIQELFGWKESPRLAGGRVAVQLQLLGPNHRPQQVTEDLANFWRETYFHVRKDLKRRYAKHHWPDDPATAVATRNGLKPRT